MKDILNAIIIALVFCFFHHNSCAQTIKKHKILVDNSDPSPFYPMKAPKPAQQAAATPAFVNYKVNDHVQWTDPRNKTNIREAVITKIWSRNTFIIQMDESREEKKVDVRDLSVLN